MSSRSDQHVDERYHDPADDRPVEDNPYADEGAERRFPFLPSWGWGGAWGVMPWAARGEEYGYEHHVERETRDEGGLARFWDEGLVTLLIVGGAVLFVIPEPVTSGLGVLMMALGVVAWLIDWAT